MFESIRIVARAGAGNRILVLGQFQGQGLDPASARLDASGAAAAAAKRAEATGDVGSVVEAFPNGKGAAERVLIVGLGARDKFEAGVLRNVAAAMGRRLAGVKAEGAVIELGPALKLAKVDGWSAGAAFGEGVGLLGWVCDEFRGTAAKAESRRKLQLSSSDRSFAEGMERGLTLAEATNLARTLSQSPPNVATPAWMAEQAAKLARRTGLKIKVFKGADLEKAKFEGLINVGKASENKPCMIRLEYVPSGSGAPKTGKYAKPAVLIGKTMTYDTGGLSLKINNGMVGMKRDKDGGCSVLGAMQAIATVIKPRRRVVALLAVAENSISDEAYRPDDVLRFRNGVTVEVTNTDAEGRLVLADALCWACDEEDPAYMIDMATLTGGVVTALGSTYCGLFCEDDTLRGKIERACGASGERVWRLPMHQEYREMMKSPVADIVNSNPNRKAHPIQGAAFLSYFVKEGVPWCHLDIAGVHATEKNAGPYIEGPVGWGVRMLANLLEAE
ncbi:MAG: leucyl aminopeptidase family protein [Phycisphaerales bacterium]|nr:leucyl aminopeptidase family protein [Phycisphaerales bacterium]